MSIAVRPFRPLIPGSSLCETNMALALECSSMLRISFSEDSGRMGTAILPNAVAAKNAMPQFGLFPDNMVTLSPKPDANIGTFARRTLSEKWKKLFKISQNIKK